MRNVEKQSDCVIKNERKRVAVDLFFPLEKWKPSSVQQGVRSLSCRRCKSEQIETNKQYSLPNPPSTRQAGGHSQTQTRRLYQGQAATKLYRLLSTPHVLANHHFPSPLSCSIQGTCVSATVDIAVSPLYSPLGSQLFCYFPFVLRADRQGVHICFPV